jgi:hypothetical protein
VSHVQLPRGCDAEAGADLHTWDVGQHLFGEDEEQQLIHQVRVMWGISAAQRRVLPAVGGGVDGV